jgi:uridine kinase
MKINDLLNITEGVNDPHIFKALFVIGSSGSGKTTVAKYLTSSTGMKVVDVDKYYEYLKKSNTLTTLTTSNSQLSNDLAWDRAKVLNTNQFSSYITGRLGVAIINTGKN